MADAKVLSNQKTILTNQATIVKNQKAILSNQSTIVKNQKTLLANQGTIKKNQSALRRNPEQSERDSGRGKKVVAGSLWPRALRPRRDPRLTCPPPGHTMCPARTRCGPISSKNNYTIKRGKHQ